jgi:hypothetical protein
MSPTQKRLPLRWLTLAEIVGVAALALAALGYWDSHHERLLEQTERAQADRDRATAAKAHDAELKAGALKLTFLMTGSANGAGDQLRLTAAHGEQVIQTQTLWFPTVIRADKVETTGNPRIESAWVEDGLRKLASKTTSGRIPVVMQTSFIEDGQTKTDQALYLVGYRLHPRLVGGPKVELEGLSLSRRGVQGDPQTAADQQWARQLLTGR